MPGLQRHRCPVVPEIVKVKIFAAGGRCCLPERSTPVHPAVGPPVVVRKCPVLVVTFELGPKDLHLLSSKLANLGQPHQIRAASFAISRKGDCNGLEDQDLLLWPQPPDTSPKGPASPYA